MRKISVKISLLYILLALINIIFFTVIIFENQIDLIIKNAEYKTKEVATNLYSRFSPLIADINTNPTKFPTQESIINALKESLNSLFVEKYLLFTEDNKVLYQSGNNLTIDAVDVTDVSNAIANRDVMGDFYYAKVLEQKYKIHFFVPLGLQKIPDSFLLFELDIRDIDKTFQALYQLIVLMIAVILVFHLIFGILLNFMIIRPIRILSRTSGEISEGKLSARVGMKRKDEFGQLGNVFDSMAQSIQDKIDQLNKQNHLMMMELKMAGEVQKRIYPVMRKTDRLSIAVYHRPLIEVSGDYHDIFPLGRNRYGFLIADVSGHGVGAALITMLIKNLFQHHARNYTDSSGLIREINNELKDLMRDYDRFFTAFYLIIDEKNNSIFTNAGHTKAYLCRPSNKKIYEMNTTGFVIGVTDSINTSFQSKAFPLQKNDKIILFTDGIIEARGKDEEAYEIKRLLLAIRKNDKFSCDKMLQNILEDYTGFIDTENRRDDETIMIVEIRE
ncbi:MAG: SpoIIE family protein phosphatase [Spirochaetales bacterium]|nr:SpoIIE family protein phosphatase [Spirochaetales bacterium]